MPEEHQRCEEAARALWREMVCLATRVATLAMLMTMLTDPNWVRSAATAGRDSNLGTAVTTKSHHSHPCDGSTATTLANTLSVLMEEVDGGHVLYGRRCRAREFFMGKISRRLIMRIFVTYGALAETAHAVAKFAQSNAGRRAR
jgi:hypothetical protein